MNASIARQTRRFQKQFAAQLAGKTRGPDHGENRRVPRRASYDVNDPKARPWRKLGDGSYAQGVVHREALLQAAKEQRRQDWTELPNRKLREMRELRDALSAELEQLAGGEAPIGRPAAVRHEIEKLDAILTRADRRLTRIDLNVLDALLGLIDFATGALFPTYETIAELAVCSRNAAVAAAARLKARGFLDWVRRSILTGNEGEFAPQREQTSNAYFFDPRAGMEPRTWQRYLQILVAKMRRLGAVPAALTADAPREIQSVELRETLARLESKLPSAST